MENNFKSQSTPENGFALLMTLVVVSVVLSIGLSMLDLSTKQVRLSSNAKDSELAFHAANAGVECARYWRRAQVDEMEVGDPITPTCFDGESADPSLVTPTTEVDDATGQAFMYSYQFTWGVVGSQHCTKIDTLVASSTQVGPGMVITGMETLFVGYPYGDDKDCDAGARCTVISVRGYNKACSVVDASNNYGIIEREVLLEF